MNTKTKIEEINMFNDHLFKSLIRSMEAREIVSGFLSKLTGIEKEKLYNASYIGGEIPKKNKEEKAKASDVIVKVSDSKHIIVEMNQYDTPNIFRKNTEYAFSEIVGTTRSKNRYGKVYLVNIDNFNRFHRKDPILRFELSNKYGDIENDMYESIHVILENIVNKKYNIDEEIRKFIEFLSMKDIEEMKEKYKEDENYMSAIGKVEKYMEDEEFIGVYDVEERRKWEMNEMKLAGLEEGITKGHDTEKRELAKKMLDEKIDIDTISRITNLTKEQINDL